MSTVSAKTTETSEEMVSPHIKKQKATVMLLH
jgi:hypothetical protein